MAGFGNVNGRVLLLVGFILVFVFAVVAAGVLAGDSEKDESAPAPSKWQHLAFGEKVRIQQVRSQAGTDAEVSKTIVKLGQDGWELVSVANFSDSGTTRKTVYYFKRPL